MAGFTSIDDLIDNITNQGRTSKFVFSKTTPVAAVANTWTDLGVYAGDPAATDYSGTSLTYVPTDDTSLGAMKHGGNVSTATKHFLNCAASIVAAAGAPWFLMCVDQLGYVPITGADVTSTSLRTVTMTALTGSARYPNGVGSRLYFSSEVAPTLGGPNISLTYTNTAGTTGKTLPSTISTAAAPVAGQIIHSGAAANRVGPFLPLAQGDTGVSDIESFTFSGGTAYGGTGQLVLHHVVPLFPIPIPVTGILSERDFVNQLPSLPRIRDGAHLKFILFNTGATTISSPIFAMGDAAWGNP